jgi:hypothetical protein
MGGTLLSEALFIPLVVLNLGAAFFLISEQSAPAALLLATTATLIMFVRPAGYFVLAGIVFLMATQRERLGWMMKWAFLPFVTLMILTALINYGVRGNGSQSQVGRVLFPHVAFLFEAQFASDGNKEFAKIAEQTMESRLAKYRSSPDRAERVTYSINDYNSRLNAIDAAFDKYCAQKTGTICSFQKREATYRDFFFSTVRHRPVEYAQLVADGLIEAWREMVTYGWSNFSYNYLTEAADHDKRIEQIRYYGLPLSAHDIALRADLANDPSGAIVDSLDAVRVFITSQRWLVYLIGIVILLSIPIALLTKSPHWLALGYCGVLAHGSMLLTTAVTVFIPRYAMPIDPVILAAGVIAIGGAFSWSFRQIRPLFAASLTGMIEPPPDLVDLCGHSLPAAQRLGIKPQG